MHSPPKFVRDIAAYPGQGSLQPFGADLSNMAGQDSILFRDPLHIQQWVATSRNTSIDSGTLTSPLQVERSVSDQGLAGFFPPGIQGPPLELSPMNDTDLYPTNISSVIPTSQAFLPGNTIVSDNGSSNGIASPVEMPYTASIHALTFTEEYPNNGDGIYSPEAPPQMAWSASTEWPSPSSLTTEPSYVNCYATPVSLPCLVNSPPLVSVSVSEDSAASLLSIDEYLHGSTGNPCIQYPVEVFQNDLIYPDLGAVNNHSIEVTRSDEPGTSRPVTKYSYSTVTDPASWLSYAQAGIDTCGPQRAIQPLTNANARGHPFYHIGPNPVDNLYHCPFVDCGHRPDKLKCNYDKHLDSHLKPYRCKYRSCGSIHFSSTACLLRHEREAHGMHGHGNDPFQCHYPGCHRGRGFPRRYNLEDHMRRMHKHEPSTNTRRRSTTATEGSRSAIVRATRRNTLDSVNELIRTERPIQSSLVSTQPALPESRSRMTLIRKRNTKLESRRKRVKLD